jgi:hypothetical protein
MPWAAVTCSMSSTANQSMRATQKKSYSLVEVGPKFCLTDRTTQKSACPECEVVLSDGVHFCFALGALESLGWKVGETDRETRRKT